MSRVAMRPSPLTGDNRRIRSRSLHDFQSGPGLFARIGHARFKFSLLTIGSGVGAADFVFFARDVAELSDPSRHFSLSPDDFQALNPNTLTCPTFRSRRDAEINLTMYRRAGILWRESDEENGNPWGLRFVAMLHMTSDSGLFRNQAELEATACRLEGNRFVGEAGTFVPLIEAKMVHHFDHRFGDYSDREEGSENTHLPDIPDAKLADPTYAPLPKYWVAESEVADRLRDRWSRGWLLGWRDITNAGNQRTVIASLIPRLAVGNKLPLLLSSEEPIEVSALYAALSSFAADYAARQKVGSTSLNYFILKQLPVLPPTTYRTAAAWDDGRMLRDWILPRVLELTFTAFDLEPFARDVGYDGSPFRWDADRRFLLRCELDAAFFHLYGLSRDDTDHVMDSFPIVRRHDEACHGEYRTKRVILEIYDQMAIATRTGKPFQTRLDPPPADPRVSPHDKAETA